MPENGINPNCILKGAPDFVKGGKALESTGTGSIPGLPKHANIEVNHWILTIEDNKVVSGSPCIWLLNVANHGDWNKATDLSEQSKLTPEALAAECAENIRTRAGVLSGMMYSHYGLLYSQEEAFVFSKSGAGRAIASEIADKMLESKNWPDLRHCVMLGKSFQKDMKQKIINLMQGVDETDMSLPETADIKIGKRLLKVRNHQIQATPDIVRWLQKQIKDGNWSATATAIQRHGIQLSALVSACKRQLAWDRSLSEKFLTDVIGGYYGSKEIRRVLNTIQRTKINGLFSFHLSGCKTMDELCNILNPEIDSVLNVQTPDTPIRDILDALKRLDMKTSRLPESANIEVDGHTFIIKNHELVGLEPLDWLMGMTENKQWDAMVKKMEQHGISSAAFALLCARSIWRRPESLVNHIFRHVGAYYEATTKWSLEREALGMGSEYLRGCHKSLGRELITEFSASDEGRKVARQFGMAILDARYTWTRLAKDMGYGGGYQMVYDWKINRAIAAFMDARTTQKPDVVLEQCITTHRQNNF